MSFTPILEAQFPARVLAADRPMLVSFHKDSTGEAAEARLWAGLSDAFGRLVGAVQVNPAEAHRLAWRYGCADGMLALFYAGALYAKGYFADIREPNTWLNGALDAVLEKRPLDADPLGFDSAAPSPLDPEPVEVPPLRVKPNYAEFTALDDASYRLVLEQHEGPAAVLFYEEASLPAAAMMPNLRKIATIQRLPVFLVDLNDAPALAEAYALAETPYTLFLQDGQAIDGRVGPQYFSLGKWLRETAELAPAVAELPSPPRDRLVQPIDVIEDRAARARRG